MYEIFTEQRNVPNVNNRLSILVDLAQSGVDDARAAGLRDGAYELDTVRERVAGLAVCLWRAEGGNR